MRERITYIQQPGTSVDPSTIQNDGGSVRGPDLDAAREDRLTLALDELPQELSALLEDSHELHIRWVSHRPYKALSPLVSRLSPGFHLFYTPRQESGKDSPQLCSLLEKSFGGILCSTPRESFTPLPVARFSHSAALQYFQPLESLSALLPYVEQHLCANTDSACRARVGRLKEVVSLDVSYDAISHVLKVTALWPYQKQRLELTSQPQHRTELGILAPDTPPNLEPHELGVSGLLSVLGQDKTPSGTLFSFPSRHRDADSTFSANFLRPTGLHPTLQIVLESNKPPREEEQCKPHAYLPLPRTIFSDQYQLSDELFLASKNLTALRYTSQPVDLEAPDYVMKLWGSALLIELAAPTSEERQAWTVEIPLHLRYLSPLQGGYRSIDVPYPTVFWACVAEEGTKFPTNPFDRANLGYDGLFGPRTVFWHVEPRPAQGERLTSAIRVPVLDLGGSKWINVGTSAAILLGFALVLWKLFSVYLRSGHGPQTGAAKISEEKKRK
ncbi:PIG-X-domain-containing protein [Thozetella sp. PMI_491]|nr:PIG-X-domain-containing protein [Thozetella sp. PMI_491]